MMAALRVSNGFSVPVDMAIVTSLERVVRAQGCATGQQRDCRDEQQDAHHQRDDPSWFHESLPSRLGPFRREPVPIIERNADRR